MLVMFVRTIVLYLIVMIAMRVMGKRQIGQLQPSELVIAIMISEVASIPMQDIGAPLLSGVVPIITLLVAEVVISMISLKSRRARRLLSGYPSILINNGKINEQELAKSRFNVDDMLEELRLKGFDDIAEVAYAILETGGQISVIPKTAAKPATVGDLKLNLPEVKMTFTVISDGHIDKEELEMANKNIEWINQQLKNHNIKSHKDVFLATIDSSGNLFVQTKQQG